MPVPRYAGLDSHHQPRQSSVIPASATWPHNTLAKFHRAFARVELHACRLYRRLAFWRASRTSILMLDTRFARLRGGLLSCRIAAGFMPVVATSLFMSFDFSLLARFSKRHLLICWAIARQLRHEGSEWLRRALPLRHIFIVAGASRDTMSIRAQPAPRASCF